MDLKVLQRIVADGESETVEFKKSTAQLSRAGETLCGFLNGRGGRVLIGVTPAGKIVGQHVSDKTQQEIAAMLQRFEPPAPVETQVVKLLEGDRKVIVLDARAIADSRPFTFGGRPYQRIGTTTSVMPQERYERLLLDRAHARRRWENQPAVDVQLEDLDHEEILRTVRLGIEAGRLPEATGTDVGEILDRLKLRSEGRLLDAAVVLFGKDPMPDYPQCHLRLARFKGIDKSEFLDNRQEHGHAFHLLEEGMAFLLRHLPIAGRFEPGRIERIDEPLFPVAALREALVNALCHRDYAITGGCVSAAIFDDRLEIWSDGTLPFGLKVEDLKRPHRSLPRNPFITGVFYRRGLVEEWGRGTQMIVDLCVRAGHPDPEFVEQTGAVGVRFLPSGYIAPHRIVHELTQRQREILQLIARDQPIPLRDIMKRLANPPAAATVRDDLYHLKRIGLLDSRGRGRGAMWLLRQEGLE
ncbi:MAG: putative DNA binding domain-containing protein [Candidatus Eisenbacteria sp.]|nr:putative DNA binding domain-containing protein [Candidatus Eisenbacteria bacterium]